MTEKIGSFLVRIGAMTAEQVDVVLRVQDDDAGLRPFGEIAIDMGYIDDSAVKKYLAFRGDAAESSS